MNCCFVTRSEKVYVPALNCAKCHLRDSPRIRRYLAQRCLYTNDLPSAVTSGSVFMYADDTTAYCIGDTVDNTVTSLNKALSELNSWCLENSLTPHSAKCEAMLLMRKLHIGPLNAVTIGKDRIEWVKHSRLLGVTIDQRLSWSLHLTDVKKNFVNKLNLLNG